MRFARWYTVIAVLVNVSQVGNGMAQPSSFLGAFDRLFLYQTVLNESQPFEADTSERFVIRLWTDERYPRDRHPQ